MQFASAFELSAFIDAEVSEQRAELILTMASSAVATAAGVPIGRVEDDTVTLDGNGAPSLLLPAWPVVAVATVAVDGDQLADGSWSWSRTGELRRHGGVWPSRLRAVDVTYTHGYVLPGDGTDPDDVDLPSDIKGVTLQVAARAALNPGRLNSFTAGGGGDAAGFGGGGSGVQVLELYRSEQDLVRRALR